MFKDALQPLKINTQLSVEKKDELKTKMVQGQGAPQILVADKT
jgi:hypothetical protein